MTPEEITELQASERKFRHLFENSPVGIYVTDRHGILLNINLAGARQFGYEDPGQLIGLSAISFFADAKDRDIYLELLRTSATVRDFETQFRKLDGSVCNVRITAVARKNLTGKVAGYEGFIIDITELKKKEQEHWKAEEKYRTTLESSLAGIFMFQDGGLFSYVNPTLKNMLEYESDEAIIGKPFWNFIHPEDREMVRARGLARERGEIVQPNHYSFRVLKQNGDTIWVDMRSSHATYMGHPAVVGNFIDITRIKQAETRIRELSRKLIEVIEEERKSLAADLHDEFGQGLTSLRFDMEKLARSLDGKNCQESLLCSRMIEKIGDLAETIRTTTSRLRPDLLDHLGLVPALEWSVIDLRKRVPETTINFQVMGFKRRLSPGIEIVLYRIFQESVNNAMKHSGADTITIKLTCSHPVVIFSCRDNGKGFELTESGLPRDETIGIGLLCMKERTDSLHGTFELKSVPSSGTLVRVEIPMQEDESNG